MVVILAAGQGKRMKSELPKVMHLVRGQPMIRHVVHTAQAMQPRKIVIIVGVGRDKIIHELRGESVEFTIQEQQLGTGHAVLQAQEYLRGFSGDVLILSGDVPLLSELTLDKLLHRHYVSHAAATVLSTIIDNPTGYGRVIRKADGLLQRIVEEKDCTPEERQIQEINAGVYLFDADTLYRYLPRVSNANAQQEYYLPDVLPLILAGNGYIAVEQITDAREVAGVNTLQQLEEINRIYP